MPGFMPKIKFITPIDSVLNIIFTSAGYALHYGGGNPNVHEQDTLIFNLPWNEISYYYYGIKHIDDLGILGDLYARDSG